MPILTYKQEDRVDEMIDGIIQSLLPVGVIVAFNGTLAAIPSGWQLCDGTNGTPDLRDKFIKGAAAGDGAGGTGGAATHTHASHGALSHTGGAVTNHNGFTGTLSSTPIPAGTGSALAATTHSHDMDHGHAFTQPSAHAAQSHDTPNSEPPYYKLVWIMRI